MHTLFSVALLPSKLPRESFVLPSHFIVVPTFFFEDEFADKEQK